jgi:hypothetical protein
MKPKALIEGSLDEEKRIGAHAQAMARHVAKIKTFSKQKDFAAVYLNQMRSLINTNKYEQSTGTGAGFNVKETFTTTGGYALRFYASIRMKLEFGGQMTNKEGESEITGKKAKIRFGHKIKVINVKNKLWTPFLKGETNFFFPSKDSPGGFSYGHDLMDLLKARGRLSQKGTRFEYKGMDENWVNVGSKLSSEEKFCSNPKLMQDAENLIRSFISERKPILQLSTNEERSDPDPEGDPVRVVKKDGEVDISKMVEDSKSGDEPVKDTTI